MPSPLLSIVIPVYNRAEIVKRTLRSLESQTYRCVHLVLVDNNSTDGTLQTLTDWQRHMADEAPEMRIDVIGCDKPGAACARNAGAAVCDTPWIGFFDSDDIMLPHHLGRIVSAIEENADCNILGWNVLYYERDNKRRELVFDDSNPLYSSVFHGSMATQRYVMRKSLFDRVGGWNNTLLEWDDIELGSRLLADIPLSTIRHIEGEPSVVMYYTEESITGNTFHPRAEKFEHVLDLIQRTYSTSISAEKAREICDIKRVVLAAEYRREGAKEESKRLIRRVMHGLPLSKRLMHRTRYLYMLSGMRGISRLLGPLYKLITP